MKPECFSLDSQHRRFTNKHLERNRLNPTPASCGDIWRRSVRMWIWFRSDYLPSQVFLIPKQQQTVTWFINGQNKQNVKSHMLKC